MMNPRSLRFLVFLTLAFAFSISPVAPARADTVPVVVTSATGSGQVGQDFSDRITTADNNSTDFAAAGLPGGLAIDPVNGNVTGVPTTAGTYVVTISATNSAGTGTMQVTLIIVPAVPVVTLTATTPEVTVGSGGMAVFTVSLSEAAATDLYVNYTIKGSAANGTDYTLLSGTKKVKVGKVSKPIKIIPQGTLGGLAQKTVKLTLAPGTGYTVGTGTFVKVKLLAAGE